MTDSAAQDGWKTHRFDEMATMVNDRIDDPSEADVTYYVGLEHLDPESLSIRRWGSPSAVTATKLRFRAGDIIFGRRRVYQRKLAVAPFDGICSAHAMVLRAKPSVATPEFLPFFMHSDLFMERAKEISVGSLSPTINWKTLAKEVFALPPLSEQQRIADLLAAQQACLALLADAHRAATDVLMSACRSLAPLGTSGAAVPITTVVEVLNTRRIPVNDAERATRQGTIPYFGANGQVGTIDRAIFDEPLILLAEDGGAFGDFASREMCYRVNEPCWVNNHAHVLHVADADMRDFVYFALRHADLRHLIVGTTRTKLTLAALKSIRLALPSADAMTHVLRVLRDCEAAADAISVRRARVAEALSLASILGGDPA